MKVKTYRADSIEKAVEEIKKDFGPEALVLSTRQVSTRKPWGIRREQWEVTAGVKESSAETAVEADQNATAKKPTAADGASVDEAAEAVTDRFSIGDKIGALPSEGSPQRVNIDDVAGESRSEFDSPSRAIRKAESRIEEVLEEIDELKRSVRFLGQALPQLGHGAGNDLFAELVAQRIEPDLAADLIARASLIQGGRSKTRVEVRTLLADLLPIESPVELESKTRIVSVFVGPTGVGKTTTIAKIAGQAAACSGKNIAMVSTDTNRVTGQEQLVRFGQLLGISVYKCGDLKGLKDLIQSLEKYNLVLIDTAGCSPGDLARLGALQSALSGLGARIHLVLSATTKPEDISRIYKRFQHCLIDSVIVTKVDETETTGVIFGELLRRLAPVSYVSNGQRVPESLSPTTGAQLARIIIPIQWKGHTPALQTGQHVAATTATVPEVSAGSLT